MKKSLLTGAIAAGTLAGSLAFSEAASAYSLTGCSGVAFGAVACQYVSDPLAPAGANAFADDPSELSTFGPGQSGRVNVNNVSQTSPGGPSFFNLSDWVQIGQVDAASGSFDLATQWPQYRNIMAVLKSGRETTLVGLLLAQNQSPFEWSGKEWASLVPGIPERGISNVRFYGSVIPTPGAVLPGLIGMGAAAFRKKKQEVEVTQEA